MINVTESAQNYFRHLLQQQDIADLGIRIKAVNGGTPKADCALEYCEPGDLGGDEITLACGSLNIYIEAASASFLEDADIDYVVSQTGGQLTIRAPHIKGSVPQADSPFADRVQYVLDSEVNPQIASHGGRVSFVEALPDGIVLLRFGGGCHGCGMADVTLKQGIEKTLLTRFPEIREVRDVTDHASGENPYFRSEEGASALR
jgi:Fe/S biogenesis protein NfuA